LKAVPVSFYKTKSIDEAISSAGGVCENSVDSVLMLNAVPGVFCDGAFIGQRGV
jgi:predicted flavoprotein YhiN